MDANIKDRIETARLASRYLASPPMRAHFKESPYLLQNPVVVCEWETTAGEVEEMVKAAQKNVEVKKTLVFIRKRDELCALVAVDSSLPIVGDSISSDQIHANSLIGHVFEALLPRKKWTITDGMVEEARSRRVMGNNFGFALA